MSDLVGSPKDQFSRVVAHMTLAVDRGHKAPIRNKIKSADFSSFFHIV